MNNFYGRTFKIVVGFFTFWLVILYLAGKALAGPVGILFKTQTLIG